MQLEDTQILMSRPLDLLDVWVQVIVPSERGKVIKIEPNA